MKTYLVVLVAILLQLGFWCAVCAAGFGVYLWLCALAGRSVSGKEFRPRRGDAKGGKTGYQQS